VHGGEVHEYLLGPERDGTLAKWLWIYGYLYFNRCELDHRIDDSDVVYAILLANMKEREGI